MTGSLSTLRQQLQEQKPLWFLGLRDPGQHSGGKGLSASVWQTRGLSVPLRKLTSGSMWSPVSL